MPLTAKGEKVKAKMVEHYGKEKGEKVFYASQNAKKITGTHLTRKKKKKLYRRKAK